jgi:protoheme IX farnesyltransferase
VRYSVALLAVSLLFVPIGAAHALYLVVALAAGLGFLAYGLLGLRESSGPRWARNLFFLSLIYLPVVFGALMVDRAT